ncbi:adenylate kinase isoenzyme 1 [Thecamonas trahens ATCC 50062]|uniref:Adenylate kinase isoenzyme 1 n=1 Tax=Thecamonas trahens ATCC 50062 TaxID=461836 RepID=A0A0L0D709_THETB|nr:adenylate kinase isoenzyme 1 [Thecamonas trahens ATCC 50062]KNC47063.1 adenylate kinase isoenzyme 1 [Thecamonas trahens ATCC 50062]|eukprot:XP_013759843.1 adenylate kinase isoenzyme 1 [Thecamonas trahens ATCC 50062]
MRSTLRSIIMASFDVSQAKAYFVLGGPGAGKGTQCAKLVEEFGFTHLSAGDLLRAERDSGSEAAELINDYIKNGLIVPMEITIGLLKTAMESAANPAGYLIDGFPRAVDQFEAFEATVVPAQFCLYFKCTEDVLEQRLLERGKTSGRVDDNIEAIKKRFRAQSRCHEIDSTRTVDEVFADVRAKFASTSA